jgi:tetratricopeptide (TPR) repeat protein
MSLFLLLACALPALAAPARENPRSDSFEDRPEPLVTKHPRSEAEQDRLDAAAQFAAGRTVEQRDELPAALRDFERAFRLDPQATPILRELVPLAYSMNRRGEAVRYAVKLAEQDDSDPTLMRRIGLYVAEDGDWKRGAQLLERALEAELRDPKATTAETTQIRVELGRMDFILSRYAEAAALFDKVLAVLDKPKDSNLAPDDQRKIVGDDGLTYELIGATFLEVKRPEDAARAFEKLNDLAPNPAVLSLNLARVDEKANRPAEALSKLEAYFKSRPADLTRGSLELLKTVLGDFKKADQLVPRLEKLHDALPDSAAVIQYLADRYRQAGRLADARPLYEAVIKKSPSAEAYRALVEIDRKTDQPEALLGVLGDVIEKTDSFDVLDKEGKAITDDDKLAAKLLEVAREKHGKATADDGPALRAAAALAAERKQFDVAGEFYELALKAEPAAKAEILLPWGLALFLAEKDSEAAKVFRRGVDESKLTDDKPSFEYYLAEALEMGGKTDEAVAVVHKMLDTKKPKDPLYAARLPWILFHAKRNAEAYQAYKDLLAKFADDYSSEDNRATLREAREALSAVCVTLHNLPEAEEYLQQSLDEFPDDAGALNDLGYLWADEGKHLHRALAMIEKAVAAEPKNSAYRDSLGWVYFRLGRDDDAITELKKATADEKTDPNVLEHLGDVYDHARKSNEALDAWKQALAGYEKDKDDEKIKQVREKIQKTGE